MKNWQGRYHRVIAPAGFEGNPTRKAYYCKTRNKANVLKAVIKK